MTIANRTAVRRWSRAIPGAAAVLVLLVVAAAVTGPQPVLAAHRLRVSGTRLQLDGASEGTFLAGVNQAWASFAADFGDGGWARNAAAYNATFAGVASCGAQAVRVWVHIGGQVTPVFGADGRVVDTDSQHTFFDDVQGLVRSAAAHGVMVLLVLWNGAGMTDPEKAMILSDDITQSYIDVVLTQLVKTLAGEPGLMGYEIINEPEGSVVAGTQDSSPCFDTTHLSGTGAGWSGAAIPMQSMLRFIAHLTATIHAVDSDALVTVGSWSEHAITDQFGYTNYYKDECLSAALGASAALDVYEVHAYGHPSYAPYCAFQQSAQNYMLDKPLIVGEFSAITSNGWTSPMQYQYIQQHGYDGGWGWQANGGGEGSDSFATLLSGMCAVRQ